MSEAHRSDGGVEPRVYQQRTTPCLSLASAISDVAKDGCGPASPQGSLTPDGPNSDHIATDIGADLLRRLSASWPKIATIRLERLNRLMRRLPAG